jgi:hypothetical protein
MTVYKRKYHIKKYFILFPVNIIFFNNNTILFKCLLQPDS